MEAWQPTLLIARHTRTILAPQHAQRFGCAVICKPNETPADECPDNGRMPMRNQPHYVSAMQTRLWGCRRRTMIAQPAKVLCKRLPSPWSLQLPR
jgi:hypothetical protein